MKRILAFILCLAMICGCAASFADEVLAPSVKIQRQMQNDGNGVKGSFRIDANTPDQPLLTAIQGAEYEILRNASEDRWHLVVFQQDEQGQQINKTELIQEATGMYIRSDFLPGRVFRIPEIAELIPASFAGAGENPSIINTVLSLASVNGADAQRWDPIAARYSSMLETWLASYAASPEMQKNADGTTLMKLIYVVPAEEIKKEIVELVKAAAMDADVTNAAGTVMAPEQMALYLNAGLEAYYTEVMNGIDLAGEIRFEKVVSTMGEMMAAGITLPLDPAVTGYRTLDIAGGEGKTVYTLTGDDEIIRLVIPDGLTEITGQTAFEGDALLIRRSTAEDRQGDNLALRIRILKTLETSTDEETGRIHEDHHYYITVERDTTDLPEGTADADFPEFIPVSIDADFHFSSKAPQSSPVTVESAVSLTRGESSLMISGKVKTAATWAFVPFSVENPQPLTALTQEEIAAALAEMIRNANTDIRRAEIVEGETGE